MWRKRAGETPARLFKLPMPRIMEAAMNKLLDRITTDPTVCAGKPCIRGTRIWVSLILDLLADGKSEADVAGEYPQLTHDDILAALAYGAEASRERIIPLPVEPAE